MKNSLGTKLYYSISEVAEITGLQPYTLRAWEKEFACLRPRRARGKNRAYRERDIGIIQLIKQLLYDEGYTTKGVKQKLKNEPELLQANSTIRTEQKQSAPTETNSVGRVEAKVKEVLDKEVEPEKPSSTSTEPRESEDKLGDGPSESSELRNIIDEARNELREILKML